MEADGVEEGVEEEIGVGRFMKQAQTDWEKQWSTWEKFYHSPTRLLVDWVLNRTFKKLLENIMIKDGKILGLGSGTGSTTMIIAKIVKAREVVFVDCEEKALEISKKLLTDSGLSIKASFLQKDVLSLKLNKKFEIVHSEGLIEHFYEDERILAFKKHVDFCQEGGIIVIFVPFDGVVYRLLTWFMGKLKKWPYKEEPFSKKEIRQLCQRFNLEILKETTLFHELGVLARRR